MSFQLVNTFHVDNSTPNALKLPCCEDGVIVPFVPTGPTGPAENGSIVAVNLGCTGVRLFVFSADCTGPTGFGGLWLQVV